MLVPSSPRAAGTRPCRDSARIAARDGGGCGAEAVPGSRRAGLAFAAAALTLVVGGAGVQILALVVGAIGGVLLCHDLPALPGLLAMPVGVRAGGIALVLLLVLPR